MSVTGNITKSPYLVKDALGPELEALGFYLEDTGTHYYTWLGECICEIYRKEKWTIEEVVEDTQRFAKMGANKIKQIAFSSYY